VGWRAWTAGSRRDQERAAARGVRARGGAAHCRYPNHRTVASPPAEGGRVTRGRRRGMSREERGDLVLPSLSRAPLQTVVRRSPRGLLSRHLPPQPTAADGQLTHRWGPTANRNGGMSYRDQKAVGLHLYKGRSPCRRRLPPLLFFSSSWPSSVSIRYVSNTFLVYLV
jgi:hypothetical protein